MLPVSKRLRMYVVDLVELSLGAYVVAVAWAVS